MMRAVIVLATLLLAVAASSATSVIYVSPFGSDDNSGTSSAPVAHVSRALALSSAGSTIYLQEGVYSGDSNIAQSIVLDNVTISSAPGANPGLVVVRCTSSTSMGFYTKASNLSFVDFTIRDCDSGIYGSAVYAGYVTVSGMQFANMKNGLYHYYGTTSSTLMTFNVVDSVFTNCILGVRIFRASSSRNVVLDVKRSVFRERGGIDFSAGSGEAYISQSSFIGLTILTRFSSTRIVSIDSVMMEECNSSNALAAGYGDATVTITDSVFKNNVGESTGAIYIDGAHAEITNSVFVGNGVSGDGGALYLRSSEASMTDVSFIDNQAGSASRKSLASEPELLAEVLHAAAHNELPSENAIARVSALAAQVALATEATDDSYGGALQATADVKQMNLLNVRFWFNSADFGGGFACTGSSVSVKGGSFVLDQAEQSGSAYYCADGCFVWTSNVFMFGSTGSC